MKKSILSLVLLLVSITILAQQDTVQAAGGKKGSVVLDINGGYSMAFGKYTENSRDEDFAGYASNGFFIRASATWLGKHSLGLAATYVFQQNKLQSGVEDDTLVGQYDALGSDPWNNHYLMAGPAFMKSIGRWYVIAKMEAGLVLSFSPVFRIWLPGDTLNPNSMRLSEGPGVGVAFQTLAGAGYHLTDKLTLNLTFSYLGGNPSRKKENYQYVYDEDTGQYLYVGGERQVKKKISTFNIGLGIAIKL